MEFFDFFKNEENEETWKELVNAFGIEEEAEIITVNANLLRVYAKED